MEPLPVTVEIANILLPGGVFNFFRFVVAVHRDSQMLVFGCFRLLDGQPLCPVLLPGTYESPPSWSYPSASASQGVPLEPDSR